MEVLQCPLLLLLLRKSGPNSAISLTFLPLCACTAQGHFLPTRNNPGAVCVYGICMDYRVMSFGVSKHRDSWLQHLFLTQIWGQVSFAVFPQTQTYPSPSSPRKQPCAWCWMYLLLQEKPFLATGVRAVSLQCWHGIPEAPFDIASVICRTMTLKYDALLYYKVTLPPGHWSSAMERSVWRKKAFFRSIYVCVLVSFEQCSGTFCNFNFCSEGVNCTWSWVQHWAVMCS